MGINTLVQNTEVDQQYLIAGQTIVENDLIVNTDCGKCIVPNTQLSMLANQQSDSGAIISSTGGFFGIASAGTQGPASPGQYFGKTITELANGNIALTYSGNNSDDTNAWVNVEIRTPNNDLIRKVTNTSYSSISACKIITLNNTSFINLWISSNTLYFEIRNNSGTVTTSAVTVDPLQGSPMNYFNVEVLNSGDFIVAYAKNTGSCSFKRYNSSGVLQGSEVVVEASSSPRDITVVKQSNGGFIVYYWRSTSTAAYKFARYNATGTIQGTLTTVQNSGNLYSGGWYDSSCIELSNGNLVFMCRQADAFTYYAIYSSTGTLVLSPTQVTNNTSLSLNSSRPGMCASDNGFVIVTSAGTPAYIFDYDLSGNAISFGTVTMPGSQNISSSTTDFGIFVKKIGYNFAIFLVGKNGSGNMNYTLVAQGPTGTLGSIATVLSGNDGTTSFTMASIWVSLDNRAYIFTRDTALRAGNFNLGRKNIFGVAQESATENQILKINKKGIYTLAKSYTRGSVFTQGTTFGAGTNGQVFTNVASLN